MIIDPAARGIGLNRPAGSQGFLLALVAGSLYLCYLLAKPFLLAISAAAVLAVVLYPLHRHALARLRHRDLAAFLSTISIVLLVLGPALLIGYTALGELRTLYGRLAHPPGQSNDWGEYVSLLAARVSAWVGIPEEELRSAAVERIQQASAWLLKAATAALAEVGGSIMQAVITFVTLYFFLRDGPAMLRRAAAIAPLDRRQTDVLFSRASQTIVANMYGVVAVAGAQGVLGGLGIWWAGLPSPVLWGIVIALFSLVPVFGSGIVWGPAAIYLFATGHWGRGLFLVIWGAVVVAQADNVIRPAIVSGRMHLNPLFVFFALLGGMNLFGLIGVFIGPVILSVAVALVEIWRESYDEINRPTPDSGP